MATRVTGGWPVWEQIGDGFRTVSRAAFAAGLLAAFYTEAFSDLPGRNGRPKPPLARQRLVYLGILAAGLPGVAWGFVRAARGQQQTPWE